MPGKHGTLSFPPVRCDRWRTVPSVFLRTLTQVDRFLQIPDVFLARLSGSHHHGALMLVGSRHSPAVLRSVSTTLGKLARCRG